VLSEGRIVKTGGKDLALELEAHGYDPIKISPHASGSAV
jgi:Fe-S cluster assembly ATPase SufC